MSAPELLHSLRARGVAFTVGEDGSLRVRAPQGALTSEERAVLPLHKADLLRILRNEAETSTDGDRLSLQQERLWYLHRIETGLTAYNLSGAFLLDGDLDPDILEEALRAFVQRHQLLRGAIRDDAGSPVLDISSPATLSYRRMNLEDVVGDTGTEDDLRAWLEEEAEVPLPLDAAPLVRFTLIRISENRHVLFLVAHHLVWDGRCFDIFLRDVGALYEAALAGTQPNLPVLDARYQDFVAWQRRQLTGTRLEEAARFWNGVFHTDPPNLDLPTRGNRPPRMTYEGDRVPIRLEADVLGRLRDLARKEGSTIFLLLLAVFKVLLHRYTAQRDLVVATPVEGRSKPEFEDLIGFFVNTLVLRTEPSPDLSFRAFHRRVRDAFLDAVEFQDTPFEWLVQEYARRDPGRTPLFQAMFTHQQTAGRQEAWGPMSVRSFPRGTRSATTDLGLWIREYDDYMDGGLDYRVDLFERATMEGMAAALQELLGAVLEDPEVRVSDARLLSPARQREETVGRSGPSAPEMFQGGYLAQVRSSVESGPTDPALQKVDGGWMSRREVWDAAERVADALLESGVQPGDVVGVLVSRSEHVVPLLLGIHRIGRVYLPLDPDFPDARLRYVMRDSGATVALVDASNRGERVELLGELGVRAVSVEEALSRVERTSHPLPPDPDSSDVAYLMYTSGSTGNPKAVAVEHGSLANLLASVADVVKVESRDTFLAVTTMSFDISLLELLLPLCMGARLIVADGMAARDSGELARILEDGGVTVMQATPTTWLMLLEGGWRGQLRILLSGGEALPRMLAENLIERAEYVWNLYGPTETTVWSTADRVLPHDEGMSIGRPLHNTRIYILDAHRNPVPLGATGEIWIGGAGLAREYHDRPRLTSESFLTDPFLPGGRIYRTGDLGRWKGDGRLEHLGRVDLQVKVNGFRIEPGEIEAALERCEEVQQAVVEARGTEADRRLVAFVRFEDGRALLGGEIRRRLRETLPSFMIPALTVEVDEFPLTPNGKIDRRQLKDPLTGPTSLPQFEEPKPGLEATIAGVWRRFLGVTRIGRHDNFFDLGGHSLLSIRATVEVEQRAGVALDPRDFFFRSLAELAAAARR